MRRAGRDGPPRRSRCPTAGKASSSPSGARRSTPRCPGPLGVAVEAEWRLLPAGPTGGPTAVIEMSRAAGRSLLPDPSGDDPVAAGTAGVGHLILSARDAGATRIVIGCGGSATTDGGWGAVQVIGTRAALAGIELQVACDVTTRFVDAAAVFGPQKGASPEQIVLLTDRLRSLSDRYRRDFGVDVDTIAGAGAAGGLAGGPRRPGGAPRARFRPRGGHDRAGGPPRVRPTSSSPARAIWTPPPSRARSRAGCWRSSPGAVRCSASSATPTGPSCTPPARAGDRQPGGPLRRRPGPARNH